MFRPSRSLPAFRLGFMGLLAILIVLALWASSSRAEEPFRFVPVNDLSLALHEGDQPILVYNHGVITPPAGVAADRARSTYVHPLYGLDGEILTDDFPADHHHHRGLFWAWPHVTVGNQQEVDLWAINGVVQKFEKWLDRQVADDKATLAVQNGWYIGDRKIVDETVRLTVHRKDADGQARSIDLDFSWIPIEEPLTLSGAEGKSYGGLNLRYAPGADTAITAPSGRAPEDLYEARLPWADLTRTWEAGGTLRSGAALFIPPNHPDYPPTWLTRHYGVLCIGWPGVVPRAFPAGKPIEASYRVWIHRGEADARRLQAAYEAYLSSQPKPN